MPKNHYSHKLGVRFFIFVAEIMNYKKCTKCELNYITDDEEICATCRPQIQIISHTKKIETDFLDLQLNGLSIHQNSDETVLTFMMEEEKELVISSREITYDDEVYALKSSNASYDVCVEYKYQDLDDDYYLVMFTIPVLIDGVNTTNNDDLTFIYLGLKNEFTNYLDVYPC